MQDDLSLKAYDYVLPPENIAQQPADRRDHSRLLVLNRNTSAVRHLIFKDIVNLFMPGDILVVNDTKVFPARLLGKKETGGKAEVFLLGLPVQIHDSTASAITRSNATALVKSSKRPAVGSRIIFADQFFCRVMEHLADGKIAVELQHPAELHISELLSRYGSVPLPPYIERSSGPSAGDRSRYQTVYAMHSGAVAAPTAGLHFTRSILDELRDKGVETASLTLHVGYGTFAPVRSEAIEEHQIHSEYLSLSQHEANRINAVKERGGKVWAVGTTTVRALEYSCDDNGTLQGMDCWCNLYITPGFKFKVIDNLITNFHLPRSSLLFLVAALCGRITLLECYEDAIARGYRFYSYGDAMAILS